MTFPLMKELNEAVNSMVKEEAASPSVSRTSAAKVYHRDYVKTKNKKYRKDQKKKD